MMVVYGDKLSIPVTKEFKQLVNISIAAGKFILIHPQYELIQEAMRLKLFEDQMLEDFDVHNWQYETGEVITYDHQEVLFFYSLLELSCRIFLTQIGDDLRQLAIDSGETNDEEFNRVRGMLLRQAEKFLKEINAAYDNDSDLHQLHYKIERLNSIA
jgi:hypothetical protein